MTKSQLTWLVLLLQGFFRRDRTSRPPSPPDAGAVISTALQLARAMKYLHAQDIIHGAACWLCVMRCSFGRSLQSMMSSCLAKSPAAFDMHLGTDMTSIAHRLRCTYLQRVRHQ